MPLAPVANFQQPNYTGASPDPPGPAQTGSAYALAIDAAIRVLTRLGDMFAPNAAPTPNMTVILDPGHLIASGSLLEVGAYTAGNTTSGSGTITGLAQTAGIAVGQLVTGAGIPAGTTVTSTASLSSGQVSISNNATATNTATPLAFRQVTSAFTAPAASHFRIDRIVISTTSGALQVVAGTATTGTPSPPAIPANTCPVAQVYLTAATIALTNQTNISDERDFTGLGAAAAFGTQASLASAATTDLGSAGSSNIKITGTTTITSFGSSASTAAPLYLVQFAAALTLTSNATSLILPGGANIKTAASDSALALYLGAGNWQILDYFPADGSAISITGAEASLASAATCDLGSTNCNLINVTGTTTITGLGSSASTANPLYWVRFAATLTLTYNATSLILPAAANITTAAGDTMLAQYLGSGNWRVRHYFPANGKALVATSTGTLTAGTPVTMNPLSSGTVASGAHGLGANPTFVKVELVNLTSELGFAVNDVLLLSGDQAAGPGGVQATYNSTTLYVACHTPIGVINESTGATGNITAANWKAVVTPYLLN